MMMTTVRGKFREFQGTITADEGHPEGCCVEVEIEAASIDTGTTDRDTHLRSADFFDVERYPSISCTAEIDRRDWGLRWNQAIETGGVLVANRVRISAEVQFVRQEVES